MFAFADPSEDPIAGPVEPEQLDWSARVAAGLDRLVADFELDALTYYYRGLDGNEAERLGAGRDRRQLAADRARRADGGRGRPQDQPRPADPRPPRRGRLLHRVLRPGLRGGLRADGPRRARPRRDRPGAADAARAEGLPRQARRRAERRVQGPLRPDHDRRLHADGRRAAEAAGRRGRVDPRRDVPDRQHELAPALRRRRRRSSSSAGAPRARPITSRWASATWRATCARSPRWPAWTSPRWADGTGLLPAAGQARAPGGVHGAPPRGVAGDARRAAGHRLAQLLAVPRARRAAGGLPGDRRLRGGRSPAWRRTDVNARWQAEMAPFFELPDDERPDTGLARLEEVFHLA